MKPVIIWSNWEEVTKWIDCPDYEKCLDFVIRQSRTTKSPYAFSCHKCVDITTILEGEIVRCYSHSEHSIQMEETWNLVKQKKTNYHFQKFVTR
jgi:hypothetical protein